MVLGNHLDLGFTTHVLTSDSNNREYFCQRLRKSRNSDGIPAIISFEFVRVEHVFNVIHGELVGQNGM